MKRIVYDKQFKVATVKRALSKEINIEELDNDYTYPYKD